MTWGMMMTFQTWHRDTIHERNNWHWTPKIVCSAEDIVKGPRRQTPGCEKMFTKDLSKRNTDFFFLIKYCYLKHTRNAAGPRLLMRSGSAILLTNWTYRKSDTHVLHLTYRSLHWPTFIVLRTRYIRLQVGSCLEFHLKSNLPLLPTSRRHRWEFCRHDGMQKHKSPRCWHRGPLECQSFPLVTTGCLELTAAWPRYPASQGAIVPHLTTRTRSKEFQTGSEWQKCLMTFLGFWSIWLTFCVKQVQFSL